MAATSKAASPTWTLVWNDEFSGAANTAPDATRWTYDTGGGGWGNGELETYTTSTQNCHQDGNGHLIIEADNNAGNYTSARIKTQGLFNQAYGRIEASIQLPQGGTGIWPAFWSLGANITGTPWPGCGEIDFMEDGLPWSNTVIGGHIHGPMSGGGDYNGGAGVGTNYTLPSGSFNNAFHTFAVEWSPNQIIFYVDSTAYQTLTPASLPGGGQWVFNHPFFIILNLAIGGTSGNPSGSPFPQQMLVDYVRVYKLTSNGTTAYGGTPAAIPGKVEAENFDAYNDTNDPSEPGEGFAYNDLDVSNNGGQYRTGDAVDIETCTDTGGGYDIGWTHPGEWLQYTVNISNTGLYDLTARVASQGAGGTFHLDLDGNPLTGELSVPDTGGWQSWQNVSTSSISLPAGQHQLLLVEDSVGANGSVGNLNYLNFSLHPSPSPSNTPSPLPSNTFTPLPSPTPSFTPQNTATSSRTASPSATGSASPTVTASMSPTVTLSASASLSQSPSTSPSPSATHTQIPATPTATVTLTGTQTFTSTATRSATLSASPSSSFSSTPSPWLTATPSFTVSPPWTATISPTFSPSASASPSFSSSPTPSLTATSSYTSTFTLSATPSFTNSPSPSATPSSTSTGTPSGTLTATLSATPSNTPSLTASGTATASVTPSATNSSILPTASYSATPSSSASPSPRSSATLPTFTFTPTLASTPSSIASPSLVPGSLLQAQLAPNPSDGTHLKLLFQLDGTASNLQVQLYSVAFVKLWQANLEGNFLPGWNPLDLPVPGLARGTYYLVTQCGGRKVVSKFVVLN